MLYTDYSIAGQYEASPNLADRLAESGFVVIDNFLYAQEVSSLLSRFAEIEEAGDFYRAGIGRMQQHQVDRTVRGDRIYWIDGNGIDTPEQQLLQRMYALMDHLNRACFLGLKDIESHLAYYPAGTFYKRHSDRFRQHSHRVLSFVCYLNRNWQPVDGGVLRMYLADDTIRDLEPLEGRLVVFRSELEHEVLPTSRERYSITGWMLDQLASLTFL
jgi:SM-20-related protein